MHIILPGEVGICGGYCKWDTNQKRKRNIISTALLSQNAWIVLLGLGVCFLFFWFCFWFFWFVFLGREGGVVQWSELVLFAIKKNTVTSADFGWNMHHMFKTEQWVKRWCGDQRLLRNKIVLSQGVTKPCGEVREVGRGWIGTEG